MVDRRRIRTILDHFAESTATQDEARALYINAKVMLCLDAASNTNARALRHQP